MRRETAPTADKSKATGVIGIALLALLQSVIWGLGNPLTKIAYEYTTPFMLLALRFTVATLLFALFFGRRITRTFHTQRLGPALVVGLTTAFAFIFAYLALSMTTATTAGFLMAISVVFMPLFARLVQGTPLDFKIIPVTLMVLVGMYLLCGGGQFRFGWGEALAVLSSVSFGFSLAFSARYLRDTDTVALTFSQCAVTMLVCWGFGLVLEPLPDFAAFDMRGITVIAILAVGCSFACYLIQNFVLARLPSTLMALILSSESVFSALFAFILLGERLDAVGFAGAALILAGVVLATLFANRQNAAKTPAENEETAQ